MPRNEHVKRFQSSLAKISKCCSVCQQQNLKRSGTYSRTFTSNHHSHSVSNAVSATLNRTQNCPQIGWMTDSDDRLTYSIDSNKCNYNIKRSLETDERSQQFACQTQLAIYITFLMIVTTIEHKLELLVCSIARIDMFARSKITSISKLKTTQATE